MKIDAFKCSSTNKEKYILGSIKNKHRILSISHSVLQLLPFISAEKNRFIKPFFFVKYFRMNIKKTLLLYPFLLWLVNHSRNRINILNIISFAFFVYAKNKAVFVLEIITAK